MYVVNINATINNHNICIGVAANVNNQQHQCNNQQRQWCRQLETTTTAIVCISEFIVIVTIVCRVHRLLFLLFCCCDRIDRMSRTNRKKTMRNKKTANREVFFRHAVFFCPRYGQIMCIGQYWYTLYSTSTANSSFLISSFLL